MDAITVKSCISCYKVGCKRWNSGPDGPCTLCHACYSLYLDKKLPLYRSVSGKVSARHMPGSDPVLVKRFFARESDCTTFDRLNPCVRPATVEEHAKHVKTVVESQKKVSLPFLNRTLRIPRVAPKCFFGDSSDGESYDSSVERVHFGEQGDAPNEQGSPQYAQPETQPYNRRKHGDIKDDDELATHSHTKVRPYWKPPSCDRAKMGAEFDIRDYPSSLGKHELLVSDPTTQLWRQSNKLSPCDFNRDAAYYVTDDESRTYSSKKKRLASENAMHNPTAKRRMDLMLARDCKSFAIHPGVLQSSSSQEVQILGSSSKSNHIRDATLPNPTRQSIVGTSDVQSTPIIAHTEPHSMSLKVTCPYGWETTVRCLSIPKTLGFKKLEELLAKTFEMPVSFSIRYIDDVKDEVTISSENEMRLFVDLASGRANPVPIMLGPP